MMMDNGYVKLPIETYDELMRINRRLQTEIDNSVPYDEYEELLTLINNGLRIEKDWNDAPRLVFDPQKLIEIISRQFYDGGYDDKYTINTDKSREVIYDMFTLIDEDDQA